MLCRRFSPLLRQLAMIAFVSATACDFGGGAGVGCGGSEGCLRVHQGDYEFPVKRIVPDSLRLRVTQGGMDFLTDIIYYRFSIGSPTIRSIPCPTTPPPERCCQLGLVPRI